MRCVLAKPLAWLRRIWRGYRKIAESPGAAISVIFLILLALTAILAPMISPRDPFETYVGPRLGAPSWEFPFGTDILGRDILSRIIYGSQLSLVVGILSAAVSLVFGVILGTVSGFYGGRVDSFLMKVVDVWLGFPPLILALAIVTILGKGVNNVIMAVGVSGIPRLARIVRAQVLSVRETSFIEASRALGVPAWRIMFVHIVPNVLSSVIVLSTLQVAGAIISAASLSFLGMGAQPPTAEWGLMLNEGRAYMRHAWWMTVFPGMALFVTVMAVNLLGDRLREMLDPRFMRGRK
jgi:peptide/nickel transport system permease protein